MVDNAIFTHWLKDEKNILSVLKPLNVAGEWEADGTFLVSVKRRHRAEGMLHPLSLWVACSLAKVLPLMTKTERLKIDYPLYISYYDNEPGPDDLRERIEAERTAHAARKSGEFVYFSCDSGRATRFDDRSTGSDLEARLVHWLGLFAGESPLEEVFFYGVAGLFPVYPQIRVGPYRVDYLTPGKKPIVWEIDGKKYHKSREQKRKDKERDEYLKGQGFHVERVRWPDLRKGYASTALEIYKRLNK